MNPVDIVEIEKLIPIYKNGEEANAIQVARIKDLEGNSCEFNIVVGKGLYNIGDKLVYIQPDYCIPDTEVFKEYYFPFGDPSKSKLGKKGRIRAVKFNFQFQNESDPIYSNGILFPLTDDLFEIGEETNLQELLGVTKYEAEERVGQTQGLVKRNLPHFLYATDETRIELFKNTIDELFKEGEVLSFTKKIDGSSATIYYRGEDEWGVCSRTQEKKWDQSYVSRYKKGEIIVYRYLDPETQQNGWIDSLSRTFYTDEQVKEFEPITAELKDAWVEACKKYYYIRGLARYCEMNSIQLALRGELVGQGNKGSGNKLNQDAKGESRIVWFGVDSLASGFSIRIHYGEENNLEKVCEELGFEYTKELFSGVFNYDEVIKKCNEYFKKVKEETGQIIEGIVIRSKFSNKLSTKYINPEYDSKS